MLEVCDALSGLWVCHRVRATCVPKETHTEVRVVGAVVFMSGVHTRATAELGIVCGKVQVCRAHVCTAECGLCLISS